MEKFNVKGTDYWVRWTHYVNEAPKKMTLCEIFTDQGVKENKPLSYAWATLSKNDKDKFSKRFGRRLSLQRALLGAFNKEERANIWDQVFLDFKCKMLDQNCY